MQNPSDLLFSQFKVFKIHQIYYNVLLNYIHKNKQLFSKISHKYNTKKSVYTRLVEPLCHTTSALNHGCNFGTRLYNKIIEKHTALEQYNCIKFKKEIKKIIYNEYIHSDAQIFIS